VNGPFVLPEIDESIAVTPKAPDLSRSSFAVAKSFAAGIPAQGQKGFFFFLTEQLGHDVITWPKMLTSCRICSPISLDFDDSM